MNGETTVVGVKRENTLPEQAMMTMGDAQRYMDKLEQDNPTAFRLAQIAIIGATGGPVKAVTTTIVDEAINQVAGEQIAMGMETVTAHAGTLVTDYDDSVDEFREDVRQNQNGDQARIQDGGVFVASTLLGLDLPGRHRTGDGQQNVVESDAPNQLEVGRVESYNDSKRVTGDGSVHRDHQPSVQALYARAEEIKGSRLTTDEKRRIRENAQTVTVPADVHRAGPTYGGNNTPALQQSDAKNLQSAATRDADTMVDNARDLSPDNVPALQNACDKIKCITNNQYDDFLFDQLDE